MWSDTWNSSEKTESNKASVENGFGDFLVEGIVSGYGAFRGAKAGYLRNQTKLATSGLFGGKQKDAGVVVVQVDDTLGSGFAVDSHHIVTNMHVAAYRNRGIGSFTRVSANPGTWMNAKIVAFSDTWDLALLKTTTGHGLKPLKLASVDKVLEPGAEVIAAKRGIISRRLKVGPGIHESTGSIDELSTKAWNNLNVIQRADDFGRSKLLSLLGGGELPGASTREALYSKIVGVRQGWSGSPLIERKTGEVVGVISGAFFNPKTYRSEFSESVKGVHEMLAAAASRERQSHIRLGIGDG